MSRPEHVRRVAVVGSPGAGTTTLVQALLGRPVRDPLPTTELRVGEVDHDGTRLILLDVPGNPELVAARTAGLRAADGVLFVVSASGGLDAPLAQLWARCEAAGVPRAVAVTGVDRERGDYDEAVALSQRLLDDEVLPVQMPMHDDDGTVAGVLLLLTGTVVDHSTGGRVERAADPEHLTLVREHRADLVEAVLAEAEDESLLDGFLDGVEPSLAELADGLHRGVAGGHLHPALAVAPLLGVGLYELRELLAHGFPSPLERPAVPVTRLDGSPASPLEADPDGPLCAEVLSSSYAVVLSGTLTAGTPVLASSHGGGSRTTTVDVDASAGEVVAVAGLRTGDTLSSSDDPLLLAGWNLPEPLHPVAVRGDAGGLEARVQHDPGARVERGRQLLVWTQGEHHAAVLLAGLPTEPVQVSDAGRWWALEIAVPTAFARTVASDLRGRQARATTTEVDPDDDELSTVRTELPEAELLAYAPALRAVAHGTATVRVHPNG